MHWEGLSEDEESDMEICDVYKDFFDEADDTINKYIEIIQQNWKSEAANIKFIYKCGNQLRQQ